MTKYRLQSSPMVAAPGIIAWAINGYVFPDDQERLLRVVADTWSLPDDAATALLSKAVPYEIEDEAVCFEFTE